MKTKDTILASPERMQTENGGYLRKQSNRTVRKSIKPTGRWKKLFSWVAVTVMMAGIALGGYHLSQSLYYSDHFQLRQINFYGNHYTKPEQLRAQLLDKFSGSLLALSLKEIRATLETNPWVLQAQVRRVLPDTLQIHLTEREPIAPAMVDNVLYIISRDGIFLDRYSSRYGTFSYPVIHGLEMDSTSREANRQRVALFVQAMEELDGKGTQLSKTISEVDLTDMHNLIIIPNEESVRILLGEEDFYTRYQSHLRRLNKFRQVKESYGPVEAVDLRFQGQVIYQRVKNEISQQNGGLRPQEQ
jgi:cell division septal protein FtsQ